MNIVAQMQDTDIQKILVPTMSAFAPLLEPKRAEISQVRKTFKYSTTERHQLDVYYPPSSTDGKKHPVLFFVYGGGFVSGERTLPAPVDLGYGNLGLYFAKRGFVTVIPDYRLAPGTTFPGPAEDLRDALAWAGAHPTELGPDADLQSIFLMGHSAGGVHVLTLLLNPAIAEGLPRIKGAVSVSAPLHFEPAGIEIDLGGPLDMYYGSTENANKQNPLALLRAASGEGLPPLALVSCERDPAWFPVVGKDFYEALVEKDVKPAPMRILAEEHNHISVTWALGTGQGEKWAEEVVKWMEGL
ncbi:alpha beta hydrolase domain-containing protein [Mycena epipterygia]|nr:alpha beta hydrolase domain-containing protein [Mycena epipterygia]